MAGRRKSVRKLPTDFTKVMQIVGPDLAAELCKEFGGSKVYVPHKASVLRGLQELAIYRDREAGMSYTELARKWGMTDGGASKLCKRVREGLAAQKKGGGDSGGSMGT